MKHAKAGSCDCRPPYLDALRSAMSVNRGAFVSMVGGLVAASAVRPAMAAGGSADVILINGRFRTMAARQPVAEAVAVTGGRFSAIGSKTHVMTYRGPKTEIVDVKGATVLPGFVEPHMHFIYEIVIANMLVASYPQTTSLDAFLAALKGGLAKSPGRPVVRRVRIRQLGDGAVSSAHDAGSRHRLDRRADLRREPVGTHRLRE